MEARMSETAIAVQNLDKEQIDLIKRTVARGASDDELHLFLHACRKSGLDPIMRQIYAVKRWDSNLKREVMTVQTGIDGFRIVAERTGKYAPGREPSFAYTSDGEKLISAPAYIKKQTPDGSWHEVAATARCEEYVQLTKDGNPTRFWQRMPHVMLAKVAEAVALRRAVPMDLSGVYSTEEMTQADAEQQGEEKFPRLREPGPKPLGTDETVMAALAQPDPAVAEHVRRQELQQLARAVEVAGGDPIALMKQLNIRSIGKLPVDKYEQLKSSFRGFLNEVNPDADPAA